MGGLEKGPSRNKRDARRRRRQEFRGDQRDVAVHIGSHVMNEAGPGDVLVMRTVRDLVAGAGIELTDRLVHALKGVPEPQEPYAVERQQISAA